MTREEAINCLDNYRKLYADIAPETFLEALDILLSESPLPSDIDVDEAANRQAALEQPYKWEQEQNGSFGVTPLFVMSNIRSAFKGGAEYLAEQGYSQEEIVEDKSIEIGYGVLPGISPIINLPDSFKPGDKVIVQIRKKQ